MKKIIVISAFVALLLGSFFFYNGQKNLIADDKDKKCCNTECTQKENCQKQCDGKCDGKCENCTKQCETKSGANNESQSQMKSCPKTNCSQKTEATKTSGSCSYRKQ